MVDAKTFRELMAAFSDVTEEPHFEKASFRLQKKIIATLDETNNRVTLKLSPIDQSVFCKFDPSIIYPATGGWGKQGWTIFELSGVRKAMLKDALQLAYKSTSANKSG